MNLSKLALAMMVIVVGMSITLQLPVGTKAGYFTITFVIAQEGEGGNGGDNPRQTKTITLNKKTYTVQDLKKAAKSVFEDKDTVIITGTNGFGSSYNTFGGSFISLARYAPELATELLNKWLKAKTFDQKHRIVRKIQKKILKLYAVSQKYGSKVQQKILKNAAEVMISIEHDVREAADEEDKAKKQKKKKQKAKKQKAPSGDIFRSDIRSKRDLRLLATLSNGLAVYRYRYIWSDQERIGVMAQHVQKIIPAAVKRINGWLYVDYRLLFASQELQAELRLIGLGPVFWRAGYASSPLQ